MVAAAAAVWPAAAAARAFTTAAAAAAAVDAARVPRSADARRSAPGNGGRANGGRRTAGAPIGGSGGERPADRFGAVRKTSAAVWRRGRARHALARPRTYISVRARVLPRELVRNARENTVDRARASTVNNVVSRPRTFPLYILYRATRRFARARALSRVPLRHRRRHARPCTHHHQLTHTHIYTRPPATVPSENDARAAAPPSSRPPHRRIRGRTHARTHGIRITIASAAVRERVGWRRPDERAERRTVQCCAPDPPPFTTHANTTLKPHYPSIHRTDRHPGACVPVSLFIRPLSGFPTDLVQMITSSLPPLLFPRRSLSLLFFFSGLPSQHNRKSSSAIKKIAFDTLYVSCTITPRNCVRCLCVGVNATFENPRESVRIRTLIDGELVAVFFENPF